MNNHVRFRAGREVAGAAGAGRLGESAAVASLLECEAESDDLAEQSQPHLSAVGSPVVDGDGMVGESSALADLRRQIVRVAGSDVPVCLLGESGAGKELAARALHLRSGRRGKFVAINCAAIPSTLQDAELFGYEKGAYTGAVRQHRGRFEEAQNGTIFLDEVGEMAPSTQALLLRTLQERVVRRIGGLFDIQVNARVVSATHRDLQAEVRAGRFRQDLYFRLMVYPLRLPALRDRLEDLPRLIEHFVRKFTRGQALPEPRVTPEALALLRAHSWPGNVRELENVICWALLNSDGPELGVGSVPAELQRATIRRQPADSRELWGSEVVPLHEVERRAILHALRVTQGRVGEAARLLQVGRATLYRRIAQHDIDVPDIAGDSDTPQTEHAPLLCDSKSPGQ